MSSDSHRKERRRARWRRVRVHFRRFRITVLLALFALVCLGGYLNQIGLPDFIRRPLLANLREHGVDLEFSRLRLRAYRGIVADDVRLAGLDNPALPRFTARSADVKLNYAALARLKVDIVAVTLNGGSLRWQFEQTNAPAQELAITNLMAHLRFLPGDQWNLDRLDAEYLGARFSVTGQVTNASALPALLAKGESQSAGTFPDRLRRVHQQLERIHFVKRPEFRVRFSGDATHLASFKSVFIVDAPDATTPWGSLRDAQLTAQLDGQVLKDSINARVTLEAGQVQSKWGTLEQLHLDSDAVQVSTNEIECNATVRATRVNSEWAQANAIIIRADWKHRQHELMPYQANLQLQGEQFASRWAKADALALKLTGSPTGDWVAMDDPALGPWNHLLPYAFDMSCDATNVTARALHATSLGLTARWDAPHVTITNLRGQLAGGHVLLDADLDVLTRKLNLDGHANLDFHQLDPVLTEKSREWMGNWTWEKPPSVSMRGSLTLPAWTNHTPDWRGEVQPGIVLAGHVAMTNVSYRGISATTAGSHLSYSNRVWRLPDLTLVRQEGELEVDLQSDETSHDYIIKLRGLFDPRALASQLDEKGQRGLGYFEFTNAPWLDGEVRGRWYEREHTWAKADVAWTNVTFRAQHADRVAASLEYSNQVLQVLHPVVERGKERAVADGILFDFAANKAHLTNGYTDTDPMVIARAIGPRTAAAVEPYHFLKPPIARVHGVIPLKGERDADLHFDLAGGPFHWSRFKVPQIAGQVHWAGETVTLTNITTAFYGGEMQGSAWFDVSQRGNTPFRFALYVTNAELHALMTDLHSPTNQLEGTFTGELVINDANTTDWNSWNGHGHATLRDGLIWDTPIFGMMSSVLNTIAPGIGNSRASEAGGTYTITNSIIHTRDLDIRASGMRLIYSGKVDFQTRVNARVEAELLRDTWLLGRVFSTALWPVSRLFEYKVTGTLANPKPEPVYLVPKLFLAPLRPVQTLKGIFQQPEDKFEDLPGVRTEQKELEPVPPAQPKETGP